MRTGTGLEEVAGRNFGNVVTIEYERLPDPASSKDYKWVKHQRRTIQVQWTVAAIIDA